MSTFKTVIAVFLTSIAAITLYVLFLLSNVSSFFSAASIEKATSNIDVAHEIKKIRNSTATAGQKEEIADIINTAYEEAESHGISTKLVDEIFNSKEVKEFLGNTIGTTTDYIINNQKGKIQTSEDFNKLVDDNIDKWINNSGMDISDTKKEVLVIRLKNASAGIIDNLPNQITIDNKIDPNTIKSIQFIFSSEVKTALVIIALISLIIVIFLKKKEKRFLSYIASAPLIAGVITVATSFIMTDIITLALNEYNLSFMVASFSSAFSHNILITGLVSIIVSIILFIIYGLINKKSTKSA